jgi:hypothetical protein
MRPVLFAAAIFGAFVMAGCGHNVGDTCQTNVDCQPDGTRFCDTSAPSGYCTIDGCDVGTCPDEAVCIRFLTPVLNEPCTFDPMHPNSRADCPHADDRCVCDQAINGNCPSTSPNGHCAPEATERRWCQYKCDSNADCRAQYECRSTGTFGAEPVPSLSNPSGSPAKFCAPNAPPPSPSPSP